MAEERENDPKHPFHELPRIGSLWSRTTKNNKKILSGLIHYNLNLKKDDRIFVFPAQRKNTPRSPGFYIFLKKRDENYDEEASMEKPLSPDEDDNYEPKPPFDEEEK